MKIEIEFEEVEKLKNEIINQQKYVKVLQEELAKLDPEKLREDAESLAYRMFDSYMTAVFEKLGFKNAWPQRSVHFEINIQQELGKAWYNSERLKVNISAHVSNEFREAILSIGVQTSEPRTDHLQPG